MPMPWALGCLFIHPYPSPSKGLAHCWQCDVHYPGLGKRLCSLAGLYTTSTSFFLLLPGPMHGNVPSIIHYNWTSLHDDIGSEKKEEACFINHLIGTGSGFLFSGFEFEF